MIIPSRISYYRSNYTDVEAEEIEAPVYKKTRGVGKKYDPQGTFETEAEARGPGRQKNAKRALIKHLKFFCIPFFSYENFDITNTEFSDSNNRCIMNIIIKVGSVKCVYFFNKKISWQLAFGLLIGKNF
ncbi:hypothetical protein BpHYR1_005267 [Brachionus plicatilis]|uniref:Uncharacterized protein n=1 Tax=Brachionus plicatilis TaxID=10195 RepID=A0A3M7RHQ0_BRAPC|nr:hypothetical protein BpHYR1_005267 [Brachionus plicatilis]